MEISNGAKDDCVEITLKVSMKLSQTTFGRNCCFSGFTSGNIWNLFLFQKIMSTMALVAGPMVPI